MDAANPFFNDVARGVEDAARAEGMVVYLCNSQPGRRRASASTSSGCVSSGSRAC